MKLHEIVVGILVAGIVSWNSGLFEGFWGKVTLLVSLVIAGIICRKFIPRR